MGDHQHALEIRQQGDHRLCKGAEVDADEQANAELPRHTADDLRRVGGAFLVLGA